MDVAHQYVYWGSADTDEFYTIILVMVATGRLTGGRWQLIRDKIMQRLAMNTEHYYIIGDPGRISRWARGRLGLAICSGNEESRSADLLGLAVGILTLVQCVRTVRTGSCVFRCVLFFVFLFLCVVRGVSLWFGDPAQPSIKVIKIRAAMASLAGSCFCLRPWLKRLTELTRMGGWSSGAPSFSCTMCRIIFCFRCRCCLPSFSRIMF